MSVGAGGEHGAGEGGKGRRGMHWGQGYNPFQGYVPYSGLKNPHLQPRWLLACLLSFGLLGARVRGGGAWGLNSRGFPTYPSLFLSPSRSRCGRR